MDSTVLASLISAGAVLASGLLTLWITGSQERRRRDDAAVERRQERDHIAADRQRDECLRVAEEFYAMIDSLASLPVYFSWDEVWSWYGEEKSEKFENAVRRAVAVNGTTSLREKVPTILGAIGDLVEYSDISGRSKYEQFTYLLRLGGDLAADEARSSAGASTLEYERFLGDREKVAQKYILSRAAGQVEAEPS